MTQVTLTARSRDGAWVVGIHGEFDSSAAEDLDAADPGPAEQPLVIDLSDCTFLDSSGFRSIARLARTSSTSGRVAVAVSPPAVRGVRRVIDLLGLSVLVPVADSLGEGLLEAVRPEGELA